MLDVARTSTTPDGSVETWVRPSVSESYAVRSASGAEERYGDGRPQFTFMVRDRDQLHRLLNAGPYAAAQSFIRADFDVRGDLVAAVRFFEARALRGWRALLQAAQRHPEFHPRDDRTIAQVAVDERDVASHPRLH